MTGVLVAKREPDPYAQQRRAAVRTAIYLGILVVVLYVGYYFYVHYLH